MNMNLSPIDIKSPSTNKKILLNQNQYLHVTPTKLTSKLTSNFSDHYN